MKGLMKIIVHQTAKQTLDLLFQLNLMNEIRMRDPNSFFIIFDDLVNSHQYIYDLRIKMFKIREVNN